MEITFKNGMFELQEHKYKKFFANLLLAPLILNETPKCYGKVR